MEHLLPPPLLQRRIRVHLVGVGGNGAQMASCLARLNIAMLAFGHPFGLHVTAFDDDRVAPSNVGRQIYSPSDIGQYKAILSVHRLNQFYGLDWDALPQRYPLTAQAIDGPAPDLLISCVDTAQARLQLHELMFNRARTGYDGGYRYGGAKAIPYWLDLGNTEAQAQVVLGQPKWPRCPLRQEWERLPCVTELFRELLARDQRLDEEHQPSCSVALSLASQGLFVNDLAVRWAGQLLYELLCAGRLRQHGVLINLTSKRCGPIDIDPQVWKRFGVKRRKPPSRRDQPENQAG